MNNETQHGYLVLADISGYTSYLVGTELEHARDVLTELLELIIQRFKPTLNVAKLEGDAVFAYVSKTEIQRDELLLEIQESTYVAFRELIPSLDLKFISHFGEYLLQNVSGIEELVGSDVNLVHRLLKNHVSEATGWKAYILFTESALTQMNFELENLHELVENYEHLGEIKTYSLDLHARYSELIDARQVFIKPEDADAILTRTISAPPNVVWDWLNNIQKRLLWATYDDIQPAVPGRRTGKGSRNHCAHGKNVVIETVLDWRPFEYYTLDYPMAIQSYYLEPLPVGTRLNIYFKLKMSLPRWLKRLIAWFMGKSTKVEGQYDKMVRLIEGSLSFSGGR